MSWHETSNRFCDRFQSLFQSSSNVFNEVPWRRLIPKFFHFCYSSFILYALYHDSNVQKSCNSFTCFPYFVIKAAVENRCIVGNRLYLQKVITSFLANCRCEKEFFQCRSSSVVSGNLAKLNVLIFFGTLRCAVEVRN